MTKNKPSMLIRVVARVKEISEDTILQGVTPEEVFVWRVKYVRADDVEEIEELEKNKKTLLYFFHKPALIIKEGADDFFTRWKEVIKEEVKKEPDDVEFEIEEEEDDNEGD